MPAIFNTTIKIGNQRSTEPQNNQKLSWHMWHYQLLTNLPYSNVFDKLSKRSLKWHAQFECITANLNHVVEESADCGHWKSRRKQRHVAKLNQHLQVVFISVFILNDKHVNSYNHICLPVKHQVNSRQIHKQLPKQRIHCGTVINLLFVSVLFHSDNFVNG